MERRRHLCSTATRAESLHHGVPYCACAAVNRLPATFREPRIYTLEHVTALLPLNRRQILLNKLTQLLVRRPDRAVGINNSYRCRETVKIRYQGHSLLREEMMRTALTQAM